MDNTNGNSSNSARQPPVVSQGERTVAFDLADGDGQGVAFMAFAYVCKSQELPDIQGRVEAFLATCDEAAEKAGLISQPPGTELGYMAFTMHSLIGASSLRARGIDPVPLRTAVLDMLTAAG